MEHVCKELLTTYHDRFVSTARTLFPTLTYSSWHEWEALRFQCCHPFFYDSKTIKISLGNKTPWYSLNCQRKKSGLNFFSKSVDVYNLKVLNSDIRTKLSLNIVRKTSQILGFTVHHQSILKIFEFIRLF